MKYFDAHCHVQFPQYDEDREEVVTALKQADIGGLVVGCDLESSKKAVALAEQHDHLWASIGLHPNHEADEWYEETHYLELGKSSKVVAVGECGLDYYRPTEITDEVKRKQKNVFKDHIRLAVALDKPLVIHARPSKGTVDAYADALDLLEEAKQKHPHLRGDFHFFVGDIPTMERIVALDFTISYTAVLTFARDYDEVVRTIPLTHILSETDSPYVAPISRRGKRNDPTAVLEVAAKIAEIRGENPETVQVALLQNAKALFRL
jgi:TatD DNase family protein